MNKRAEERIGWTELRRRLKTEFGKAPSYYTWLKIVKLLRIPYHLDQLTERKTYTWSRVSKIYAKRHQKVTPKN